MSYVISFRIFGLYLLLCRLFVPGQTLNIINMAFLFLTGQTLNIINMAF